MDNNPIVKKADLQKYNELSKQYIQTKIDLSVNNTLKIDPDNLIRVDTVDDLPTTANVGDVVLVGPEGTEDHQEYWYTPFNNWEPLGKHAENSKDAVSLFTPVAFSVATSAWTTLSTAFIGRGFSAEIAADGITSEDFPDVFFDNTSVSAAANLGILAEATDGKIVFYTKSIPTTVLSGVFFIRKGAN